MEYFTSYSKFIHLFKRIKENSLRDSAILYTDTEVSHSVYQYYNLDFYRTKSCCRFLSFYRRKMKVTHRYLIKSCWGDTQIPCSLGALKLNHMEMKEVFLKANRHKEKKKREKKKP